MQQVQMEQPAFQQTRSQVFLLLRITRSQVREQHSGLSCVVILSMPHIHFSDFQNFIMAKKRCDGMLATCLDTITKNDKK
jgi:hypothetical protein